MKTPVTIAAVHLDAAKTSDRGLGNIKVSVEIDGEWLEILNENFDPSGFHISHIVEGAGIKSRQRNGTVNTPRTIEEPLAQERTEKSIPEQVRGGKGTSGN